MATPVTPRSLRDQFGVEQLSEQANDPSLARRQRAYERLAALGSPQALQRLNAALLKVLPRAKQNANEVAGLVEALAPHAGDADTQVSLLRVILGSVGPQGEPIEPELRQMAALAIAARRDAGAVRVLRRALLADTESARFAHDALLAHPPRPGTAHLLGGALPKQGAEGLVATPQASTAATGKAATAAARATVARQVERKATPQLLELLSTAPATAGLAACQLAMRDERQQRGTVQSLLNGPSRTLRLRVALGLGASPHADATGLLLQAYRDPVWQVRWAVLHALGQRRDVPSLRTLQRAATLEPNSEARDLARSLLAADAVAPGAVACPTQLPLTGLREIDEDTAVAAPNDLPEAATASKDRPNPPP
jgi:hypothetical protein